MNTLPTDINPVKLNSMPSQVGLLVVNGIDEGAISLGLEYFAVLDLPYTEETIGQAVLDALKQLPTIELDDSMSDDQKQVSLATLNLNIARNTRRGMGNCKIALEDGYVTFFYKEFDNPNSVPTTHTVDGPLAVYSYDNKFGILKNPTFDRYGFRAKYVNTDTLDIKDVNDSVD